MLCEIAVWGVNWGIIRELGGGFIVFGKILGVGYNLFGDI